MKHSNHFLFLCILKLNLKSNVFKDVFSSKILTELKTLMLHTHNACGIILFFISLPALNTLDVLLSWILNLY